MQFAGAIAVVNVDIKFAAIALPATSRAPVVTVTVCSVPPARLAEGVNV
jgi:hypothetical protein